MELEMIPIGKLRKNPFNPRKTFDPGPGQDELGLNQLADSIRNDGVLQPIVVRRLNSNFQVAAGERRRMSSEIAGLDKIPAIVRDLDDTLMRRYALIENIHRLRLKDDEFVEAVGAIWEHDYKASDEKGLLARMQKDLGIPSQTLSAALTVHKKRHTLPRGAERVGIKRQAEMISLAEKAPRAAKRLGAALESGELEERDLSEAIPIVRGADTPELSDEVATQVTRAAKVKRVAEKVVQREFARLKEKAPSNVWRKILSKDEAMLNRLADFRSAAEKFDITYLENIETPEARKRAIQVLEVIRVKVTATLAQAKKAESRWRSEWEEWRRELAEQQPPKLAGRKGR
jgi:ParB-like chromosome segregation protein Spo0J